MSMESRSSVPAGGGGEIAQSAGTGSELGTAHLAESQLTSHADIAAARSFFQTGGAGAAAPAFTGTEAAAVAGKAAAAASASGAEASALTTAVKSVGAIASAAGSEAAALGAHALAGIGTAAAAGAEVSPMIQLIMRLPGLGGVAQSFFEWMMALFTAPSHLAEIFDPTMWAHLGASIQSSLSNLTAHGISAEHFQVSLNMLPANAPFLQHLGMQAGHGLTDLNRVSALGSHTNYYSLNNTFSLKDHMNVSSPLDLKKPQLEIGQSAMNGQGGMALDGKLSGPLLSNGSFNPSSLSGTQRLFSDQMAKPALLGQSSSGASTTTFVSSTTTPATGAGSSMNISTNSFGGQEIAGSQASYRLSDGLMSGTNLSSSNNIGFHLSDAAPAGIDKGMSLSPSGAVSNTLGGKELLASNDVPSYQPSMGGSYFRPAQSNLASASDAPAPAGLTELKAEPMSLLKKAHPVMGHTPDKGAVDYIGHQTKGSLNTPSNTSSSPASGSSHQAQSMDQISHRGSAGHASAESAARHIAHKQVSGDSSVQHKHVESSHAVDKVAHASPHHAAQGARPQIHESARSVQSEQVEMTHEQAQAQADSAAAADKTAMAGTDKVTNYTVQHGDNLWDIAKNKLGDGSRWGEIYKLNSDVIGNNPDLIHTGIELKMPGADATQIGDAGNYTVQPGDNLWDIAKDKLGDGSRWGEIYDANKAIIGDNSRLILPGQQLQMPQAQSIAAAPSAAVADPGAVQATQAVAPQTQAYQQAVESTSQTAQPQMPLGPGAAGAATLDPAQLSAQGPVSASLAPDLSFLNQRKPD